MPTPPYLQSCPAPDKPPQRLRWTPERIALLPDPEDEATLRERWACLIGPMKESLRAELAEQ